jgi:hypothetical protein
VRKFIFMLHGRIRGSVRHFAGVPAPGPSVMNVVERPIFSNLSRQRPSGKDEEPRCLLPLAGFEQHEARFVVEGGLSSSSAPASSGVAVRISNVLAFIYPPLT